MYKKNVRLRIDGLWNNFYKQGSKTFRSTSDFEKLVEISGKSKNAKKQCKIDVFFFF